MPRDGAGAFTNVPGTTVTASTTILSAWANGFTADVAATFNTAWPMSLGGTGGTSAATSRTSLGVPGLTTENVFTKTQIWAKGADVASAAALNTGDDGNYFDVTGTTTITSIVTVGVGAVIKLHFDGALILTHNATDLILPSGDNITTAAGDEAEFVEYAAGDWRLLNYQRASKNDLGMELIEVIYSNPGGGVGTGLSFVDFTAIRPGEFASYQVVGMDIHSVTDGSQLVFRTMSGAPPVQDSGSIYRYQTFRWTSSATGVAGSVSDTVVSLHDGEASSSSTDAMRQDMIFDITTPESANNRQCTWSMGGLWQSGSFVSFRGNGYVATGSATTGLRFFWSNSSLFYGGSFHLYGRRR